MIGWGIAGVLLGLVFVLDGLRLRKRMAALPVVPSAPAIDAGKPSGWVKEHRQGYAVILAPGGELPEAERAAAVSFAREQGLLCLDLIPGHWPALRTLGFIQGIDPAAYRTGRLIPGWSACSCLVVSRDLLTRAGVTEDPPPDAVGFLRLARLLKQYAATQCGFAVSPGLSSQPLSAASRFAVVRELFHGLTPPVLAGQLALFLLTAAAAVKGGWLGWVGLAGFHAQALIALAQGPVLSMDLERSALLAWPWQVWNWVTAVAAAEPDPLRSGQIAALRPAYQAELSGGLERFFEERRENCYVCEGRRLTRVREFDDLLQHKPGRFRVERCLDCGHLFQNPRLSLAGLSFYYRDFYDGLGGPWLETVFALSAREYVERAHAFQGEAPGRWLDVGGGYGHFSLAAKEIWPTTRFECLDMGVSADEAVRRGWADAGHRGMLPELASTLEGQFDVVSMSHCLEHTRDPRAELAAAARVLKPGGSLVIEVPDPESLLRPLLRGLWLPYFQPQHQHLLSVGNLSKLLGEAGFEVVRVQRGEAHVGSDFFFSAFITLDRLGPETLPWTASAPRWSEWRRALVWAAGAPLLLGALGLDAAANALTRFRGVSDAYRVVAKTGGSRAP